MFFIVLKKIFIYATFNFIINKFEIRVAYFEVDTNGIS